MLTQHIERRDINATLLADIVLTLTHEAKLTALLVGSLADLVHLGNLFATFLALSLFSFLAATSHRHPLRGEATAGDRSAVLRVRDLALGGARLRKLGLALARERHASVAGTLRFALLIRLAVLLLFLLHLTPGGLARYQS